MNPKPVARRLSGVDHTGNPGAIPLRVHKAGGEGNFLLPPDSSCPLPLIIGFPILRVRNGRPVSAEQVIL